MKKTKTFLTTLSGIVPIWICTALGIIFIAFMGCEDATTMMKPVVSKEPADTTPPTTVGEVKDPAVLDEPPEPTPPADMTPPTVVEVAWYSNWQLTQPITDDVQPGNTIYTVVVFSEPMLHAVADNASARPALSIVIDGMATPYRMLTHGVTFQSGEAKPNKSGTDDFVCKYTIPADTSGTIALRVGGTTADLAGNTIADDSEYVASFVVAEAGINHHAATWL